MASHRTTTRAATAQHGAVAVSFILLFVVLLAFAGLAMDVGRLYVSKSELQNAADSCALAAAGALTGVNATQLQAAEDFGIAAGTRNLVGMQARPVTIAQDQDITFSQTLGGTYLTKTAAAANATAMRYVRCTLTESSIPTILLKAANLITPQSIGLSTVQATAVASLEPSISNCALPVAICEPDIQNLAPNHWIQGILTPNQNIQGAFKWINYTNSHQNSDLSALITGAGQCDLNSVTSVYSRPGYVDAMLKAWNTRLGIYAPGGPTIANARPDATGWVYDPILFPAQVNAMADYINKKQQASPKHQPASDYSLPNPNNWATNDQFSSDATNGGYAIDGRRLAVGPVIDCNALGGNGVTQVKYWACYLILNPVFNPGDIMHFEYLGSANALSSGCVTSGSPGGPSAGGPKVPALVQ